MSKTIIKHLKASELPEEWARQLDASPDQRVTVRIQTESDEKAVEVTGAYTSNDPAFGIWRDREDVVDVEAYARKLREPRYSRD